MSGDPFFQRALVLSLMIHAIILLAMADFLPSWLPPEEPEIMRVQLVSSAPPQNNKNKPKPAEKIKTQASVAPKEAPKKDIKAKKEDSKIPKVKVSNNKSKNKKQPPKELKEKIKEAKEEETKTKKRPPKLDKTPDKTKAIRSMDEKAKTVAKADDFLSSLDFINDLDEKKPVKDEPTEEQNESLTMAEQSEIALLKRHIEKNWLVPPGIQGMDDYSMLVEVSLNPDGTISKLKLVKSSGKAFLDNSLLRAVRKAAPLPIPSEKYELFKIIELGFNKN